MMAAEVKNPDTFVYGTIGDADTLDPAYAYDNASGTNIRQLYEPLITYDRGTNKLVPVLATQVPTMANRGISADGKTYTFTIRSGVKFHDGGTLTAEDVEYSIERVMVINNPNSAVWMYWMVFFDASGNAKNADGTFEIPYSQIDAAIEASGNTVTFKLAQPFEPFLGILTGYWGSIVDKEFNIAHGDWNGTAADMARVFEQEKEAMTLYEQSNGTGPFKFERWIHEDEIVVTRFDGYWGPKPALARGIYKIVPEWSTRKLMFLQGDLDYAYVEPVYYEEMDKEAGLTVQKDLPSLSVQAMLFNLNVNTQDNPLTGSNKLDGKGVPGNFFSDINVRLGFLTAWDEETYLRDIGKGTMLDPVTPIPFGLPYKNVNLERPAHDLTKAADYFRKAWNGQVWANGFKLEMIYNEGNETRGGGLRILAENLRAINPKFDVTVRAAQWPEFLDANNNKRMPLFFIGWAPDYGDPDNYAGPFIESTNYYATRASYKNEEADRLIVQARYATDPKVREQAYYRIQEIALQDPVAIYISQSLSRRYYRDWLKIQGGHFYQPLDADFYVMLKYFSK
jgi:peptide/nickel transport system substrate-binding protein